MAHSEVSAGRVTVSQDEHAVLTVFGEYVVASSKKSTWIVQPISSDDTRREFAMVYVQNGPQLAFTLSTTPDPTGAYNILAKPLKYPPSKEQCWTMENENRNLDMVTARLQSVAMSELSVAIQGDVWHPEGKPVSGFPSSSGRNMTWTFQYHSWG